jgi:apolipoprotein N-acyltransferase
VSGLINNAVFGIVVFWTLVLLYGLIRDQSMRSRIVRIVLVGVIWSAAPRGSWSSWSEFVEQFSRSYPAWLIVIAVLLIPVYLSGFFRLLREKKETL